MTTINEVKMLISLKWNVSQKNGLLSCFAAIWSSSQPGRMRDAESIPTNIDQLGFF